MNFWKYIKNLVNDDSKQNHDLSDESQEQDEQVADSQSSEKDDSVDLGDSQGDNTDRREDMSDEKNDKPSDTKEEKEDSDEVNHQSSDEDDSQSNDSDAQGENSAEEQNDEFDDLNSQSTSSDASLNEDLKSHGEEDNENCETESSDIDSSLDETSPSESNEENKDTNNKNMEEHGSDESEEQGEDLDSQSTDNLKKENSDSQGEASTNNQKYESNVKDSSSLDDDRSIESKDENIDTQSKGEKVHDVEDVPEQSEDLDDVINQSTEEETLSEEELESDVSELQDENDERLEKIKNLRDKLLEYAAKKAEEEEISKSLEKSRLTLGDEEVVESHEEKYELNEHTNQFLNTLKELPSFKDRDRGPGYAIDTDSYTEVSDSIIRTLITKFLNRRFCLKNTDLNVRSNSLEKSRGFYRWEVKDVITHLKTHQVTKVLNDKYGYEYANGRNENVPLSFYFDMSISMSEYSNLLAVIAIELLKKGVKVLIGFNERVNVQIDSIKDNVDVLKLAKLLETAGYSYYSYNSAKSTLSHNGLFKFKFIDQNLDNYLIDRKCEKCVVFSDFDPFDVVCNLSLFADVYWFCFEEEFEREDAENFHGFIYPTQDEDDIAKGLIKINDNRFEALCFTENPKEFTKRKE